MKVVISDKIDLPDKFIERLKSFDEIKIFDDTINEPKVIIDRLKDAEIATANFIDLSTEIIKECKNLKFIISPAAGYDWIDVTTASKMSIKVLNCPTFNSQAVAEHALALTFAVKRRILEANESIKLGKYNPRKYIGTEVMNKKLVTIGYGNIGKRVIKMAKALGMVTDYVNTKTSPKDFDQLISSADVVVLCLPHNESTTGIINKERIASMKRNSILINVARGLVVDQDALFEALENKLIAGAGIDTFPKDETISKPDANIERFVKLHNVVATPHLAYNTIEAAERLGQELFDAIESCIAGKPVNVVN